MKYDIITRKTKTHARENWKSKLQIWIKTCGHKRKPTHLIGNYDKKKKEAWNCLSPWIYISFDIKLDRKRKRKQIKQISELEKWSKKEDFKDLIM